MYDRTHEPQTSLFQVIVIESEKETGGFLAPSITVLARDGWKGNVTKEKCPKRFSKLNSHLIKKTISDENKLAKLGAYTAKKVVFEFSAERLSENAKSIKI